MNLKTADPRYVFACLFIGLCLVNFCVVFLAYEHVVIEDESGRRLAQGYGWQQLIENMTQGRYVMDTQSGIDEKYDLASEAYRPPLYPILIWLLGSLTAYSPVALVLFGTLVYGAIATLVGMIIHRQYGRLDIALGSALFLSLIPMHFLKAGTVDEAPLALLFLIASLYLVIPSPRFRDRCMILAGIFAGCAILTRFTMLFPAFAIAIFLLLQFKSARAVLLFLLSIVIVLSPWLARNYQIYEEITLSSGGSKYLLITLSDDFIARFPETSIDVIEREYFANLPADLSAHFAKLDNHALNKEMSRLAREQIIEEPGRLFASVSTRLRVLIPGSYYPLQENRLKTIMYLVSHYGTLLMIVLALAAFWRQGHTTSDAGNYNLLLLLVVLASVAPAAILFMLSRHLYTFQVLGTLFAVSIAASYLVQRQPARNP